MQLMPADPLRCVPEAPQDPATRIVIPFLKSLP